MFEIIIHHIERERRERQMEEDRARELRLPIPDRHEIPREKPEVKPEPRRVIEIEL